MLPESVLPAQALLGERPVWDERTGELLWVDIDAGELHRYRPDGTDHCRKYAASIGCVALRENGGVVLGTSTGFLLVDPNGEPERPVLTPADMTPEHFVNDGAVDPVGRFFAGTSTTSRKAGAAALYRLDPDLSMHVGARTWANCTSLRPVAISMTTRRSPSRLAATCSGPVPVSAACARRASPASPDPSRTTTRASTPMHRGPDHLVTSGTYHPARLG